MSGWYRTGAAWTPQPPEWLAYSRDLESADHDGETIREVQIGVEPDGSPVTLEVAVPAPHNMPHPERLSHDSIRSLCRMQDRLQAANIAHAQERRHAHSFA